MAAVHKKSPQDGRPATTWSIIENIGVQTALDGGNDKQMLSKQGKSLHMTGRCQRSCNQCIHQDNIDNNIIKTVTVVRLGHTPSRIGHILSSWISIIEQLECFVCGTHPTIKQLEQFVCCTCPHCLLQLTLQLILATCKTPMNLNYRVVCL